MKINELMKSVVRSEYYRSEVGINYQLGWPVFFVRGKRIYVGFSPHIERINGNRSVEYYPARYRIVLAAPSYRLAEYSNLTFDVPNHTEKPVCEVSVDELIRYTNQIIELLSKADEVLAAVAADGVDAEAAINEYQELFSAIADSLGIRALYGGYDVSYRDI